MVTPDGWIVDHVVCQHCNTEQVHVYSQQDEFDLHCSSCGELMETIRLPVERND